jgi:hypothetical protein
MPSVTFAGEFLVRQDTAAAPTPVSVAFVLLLAFLLRASHDSWALRMTTTTAINYLFSGPLRNEAVAAEFGKNRKRLANRSKPEA